MKTSLKYFFGLCIAMLLMGLGGCEGCTEEPTTGEKIEEAAEETGDALEDTAEDVGDAVEDGAEEAGDAVEDSADEIEDAVDH